MNRAEWEEKNKKDKSASPNVAMRQNRTSLCNHAGRASNILFGAQFKL